MTAAPQPDHNPEPNALDIALAYASAGVPVFPCRAKEEVDPHTGEIYGPKSPLTSNGLRGASMNERIIREWWKRFPDALIGVPTGNRIGAFVLDVDDRHGGYETLAALEKANDHLPPTRCAATASGGRHYYFRHVDGIRNSAGKLGSGLDIRAYGGYVIAPGSVLTDGRSYDWIDDLAPAEAPAWLLDMLLPKSPPPNAGSVPGSAATGDNPRYVDAAVAAELAALAEAPEGARNDRLNRAAFALGQFVGPGAITRTEAEEQLLHIASEWPNRLKSAKTVKSGLDAGIENARKIPEMGAHAMEWESFDKTTPMIDLTNMIANARAKHAEAIAGAANDNEPIDDVNADEQSEQDHDKAEAKARTANDNTPGVVNIFEWTSRRYQGEPEPTEYLVDGVIEKGIPAMVAAMGEVGKSFALLELMRRIAFGSSMFEPPVFGGRVVQEGTAVFITGEDDACSMHRRLAALDPKQARHTEKGDKLIVVPMPNAAPAVQPYWREHKDEMVETDAWRRLCDQLSRISDLRALAIDPLQLFAAVPLNEDPAAGQFVCGSVATLAAHTGANVFFAHHMNKSGKAITNLAEARDAIRGTTALVDGVRLAYAFWYGEEKRAREICRKIGYQFEPNKIVYGGVVKANGAARRILSTYARNEFGLIIDNTARLGSASPALGDLVAALVIAVEAAAADGQPFTKTGENGVYKQKARMPPELCELSRARLESLVETGLEQGLIVAALAEGSKVVKWLDVPSGQFARGIGEFREGKAKYAAKH